jgi:hypothetical protein
MAIFFKGLATTLSVDSVELTHCYHRRVASHKFTHKSASHSFCFWKQNNLLATSESSKHNAEASYS